jgi:hypothetical protein
MTYTTEMARAFRSLRGPKGFVLEIFDNGDFITLKADQKQFFDLPDEDKRFAVEYMIRAKKALEDNGAIVLLVREGGDGNGLG